MLENVYKGIYINLKRSTKRNEYIQQELKNAELMEYFTRFEAIDGDDFSTTIGDSKLNIYKKACYASHLQALKESLKYNKHIHIIEDDIALSKVFPNVLEYFFKSLEDDTWDIFFTSFTVPIYKPYYDFFLQYVKNDKSDEKTINFFDMNNIPVTKAHSYIINKNSKEKIVSKLEENNFQLPIDLAMQELIEQNYIKAYSVYPFISTHQYLESTIHRAKVELPMEFEYLSQRVFYKGYNLMDTKALIIEYAKKEGFEIKPMSNLKSVMYQILNMKDFINAKYKYKNTLY